MESTKNVTQKNSLRKHAPVLLLAAFAFLIFWQYFLLDQTFYGGDLTFALLPLCRYAFGRLASGELPLWNPHLLAGTPGLAEATHQTFYLPNILMLLTGATRGMSWLMPLHLFWLALGIYFFAHRVLRLPRLAATFAALAGAFGGLTLGGLSVPVYANAICWVPWILLGYEKARRGGWIGWAGVGLAMQLFLGAAPYAYFTLALLLAYHVFHEFAAPPGEAGSARRGWLVFALSVLIALGLGAAQLVPQTELALLSERGTHATYDYVTGGSLRPLHLPVTLLFPGFYGLFDSPTREGFLPTAEIAYLGVPALICILVALFASPRRRAVWFWLAVALLSASLAFGGYNPLYHLLYQFVPGFASLRGPTRWLMLTMFSGAILSGLGLEVLQQASLYRTRVRLLAIAAGVAVGAAGVLFLLLSGAPDNAMAAAWPQIGLVALTVVALALLPSAPKENVAPQNPATDFRSSETAASETAAADVQEKSAPRVLAVRRKRAHSVALALLGLLALDLWMFSQRMELQHTLSVAALESKPATVAFLENRAPQERFWAEAPPIPLEAWQANVATDALDFRARSAAALREMMPSCMASEFPAFGLTGAWGSLMPTRRNARPLYQPSTDDATKQRWLRLLNARYRLALQPLRATDLKVVQEAPFIYRDDATLPRAFFVSQAMHLVPEKIVDAISTGKIDGVVFDPRRQVLLESSGENAALSIGGANDFRAAHVLESRPEKVRLQIDAPRDGFLVMMDTAYPGWRATVDSIPTNWQPANYVGRALPVTRGSHEIVFHFEPQSVRFGLFVSLLTLTACIASFAARGISLRRKKSTPSPS